MTITERIKSLADAYEYFDLKRDDLLFPDPKHPYQIAANHFIDAQVLTDALNEKHEFDYDNYGQDKYVLWYNLRSSAGGGSGFALDDVVYAHASASVGPRLTFKSRELAYHAFKIAPDTFRGFIKKD